MPEDYRLIELTTDIVSAYVAGNRLAPAALAELISAVHATLHEEMRPEPEAAATVNLSAAQIRKSITADALISFEDGKPYKQLKRHLTTRGMTVAEYKAKWGLPKDYPTTAAAYSAERSALAKKSGLGRRVGKDRAASSKASSPKP